MTPEQFDGWLEYLEFEPCPPIVGRMLASIMGAIAASSGVALDESKLMKEWGFDEPRPRLTQEDADRQMRAAWG